MTAEGGTVWEHQVTVARSRNVLGPYETDPDTPLLTSVHRPDLALQKAGHGSLVETGAGEWFLAHLVGRPLAERGACVLGRETAIQRVTWTDDGWPRIEGSVPHVDVAGPDLPVAPFPAPPATDDFSAPELGPQWSTLRRPASTDWVSVQKGPNGQGLLRIAGGRGPTARDGGSLVARRIEHFRATFAATVDFAPVSFQQMAGITAYYNSRNWYLLRVTIDELNSPYVDLLACEHGRLSVRGPRVPVSGPVRLRAELDHDDLRFGLDESGAAWGRVDASILSDEKAIEPDGPDAMWTFAFTGAFFGLWVHDYTGGALPAYFSAATYQPGAD